MVHFWSIIENDVRLIGVQRGVILVISFRGIESLQRHNLSRSCGAKIFSRLELLNVRLRNALLFVAVVENRGAVLRAFVGSLTI